LALVNDILGPTVFGTLQDYDEIAEMADSISKNIASIIASNTKKN
jgi:hypothetical protein